MSLENSDKLRLANAKWKLLVSDRDPWVEDWKTIAGQFMPRKCRFIEEDATNSGRLRNDTVDSAGILSLRKLGAGMHGGMTSPARNWFNLSLNDPEKIKIPSVKAWLEDTTQRMRTLINQSNFYQIITNVYMELGAFGTAFFYAMPHSTRERPYGIRFDVLTVGEYALATNELGKVDVVGRSMEMTSRQMVRDFGYENCSDTVKRDYDKPGSTVNRYKVIHLIFPRDDRKPDEAETVFNRDPRKIDPKNKPFASLWFEEGAKDTFLRESGFNTFPGFGVRWDVTGQDVYGGSPCMDILAECRMLQSIKYTALKAEHKRADPPTVVPGSLKHPDLLPGGVNVVDTQQQGNAVYAAQNVNPDTQGAIYFMQYTREQLQEGLYNDLFAMISSSPTNNMTATQVAEMQEEKLLMLGPVIERLHTELFGPLIDRIFEIMLEQGNIMPIPDEIAGDDLRVDFISLLAQAQKAVNTQSVDRYMMFLGQYAEMFPELLDIPNPDKMADDYAQNLGVPQSQLNSQEDRDAERASRREAQQAEQNAMQMDAAAGIAQKAAGTPTQGGDSTLMDDFMRAADSVPGGPL
jgi:hypothetical protein